MEAAGKVPEAKARGQVPAASKISQRLRRRSNAERLFIHDRRVCVTAREGAVT